MDEKPDSAQVARRAFLKHAARIGFVVPVITTFSIAGIGEAFADYGGYSGNQGYGYPGRPGDRGGLFGDFGFGEHRGHSGNQGNHLGWEPGGRRF